MTKLHANRRVTIRMICTSLASAAVGACAAGPELRQPIGQTMVESSRLPQDAQDAGPSDDPANAERYITGQSAGPCGMDQLPIIEFDNASNAVSDEQVSELRRLASCLTAAPFETSSVVVIGYSDLIGTAQANLALGLERAEVVMRKLIEGGVSPARIVVASAGELQRPQARWGLHAKRVEILVARGGPPRPNEAPIARGIEAEGLLPRKTRPVVGGTPPGWPPPGGMPGVPRGAPVPRGFPPGGQPPRR